MMTCRELLRQNRDTLVQRWLEDVLATYGDESAAAFKRKKDPFANPVGHSLRAGTQGIVEALLDGMDEAKIRQHLHEIIKIRAVQDFSASAAVGFVFRLKHAIRGALGEALSEPRLASEVADLEGQVDRIALAAFDLFAQCREQVYQLRVGEVKRRVSWVMGKLNQRGWDADSAEVRCE